MNLADQFEKLGETRKGGGREARDALFIERRPMTTPKVGLDIEALLS